MTEGAEKPKEAVSKPPEVSVEAIPSSEFKQEILSSVKDGSDKEGAQLYEAYKDSLDDPEASSVAGQTYEKAKEAFDSLDQEGKINELHTLTDALYRQAGIGEGYKPVIEHEGDLTDEDRQRISREKITEDFQNYPDLYAEDKMGRYVDAKVKTREAEDKAVGLVDNEMVSRVNLRAAIFQVQQERTGLLNVIGEEASQIKKEDLGEEVVENIKNGWEYEEKSSTDFEDLEENEKNGLIEQSASEYIATHKNEHKNHTKAVDSMSVEEKTTTFGRIAEIDREVQNKKDNLKEAILGAPEEAVDIAMELRLIQVDKQLRVSEATVVVAKKRTENAKNEWRDTVGGFLKGLMPGEDRKEGAWSKVKGSTSELINSKKNELGKRFGQELSDAITDADEQTDRGVDKIEIFYERVDEKLLSRVKGATGKAGLGLDSLDKRIRDQDAKFIADNDVIEQRINEKLRKKRHGTEKAFGKAKQTIILGLKARGRSLQAGLVGGVGKTLGIEGMGELTEEKKKEVDQKWLDQYEEKLDAIDKSDNQRLRAFYEEDLKGRFEYVQEATKPIPPDEGGREKDKNTRSELMVVESEEELLTRNDKDRSVYEKDLDRMVKQESGWEEDLERSTNNYLDSLVAINEKVVVIEEENYDEISKQKGVNVELYLNGMKILLNKINEEADVRKKAELVDQYRKMMNTKGSFINMNFM